MRRVLQPFLRLETAARRFKTSGSGPSFVDRVRVHVRAGSGGQGAARLGAAGGDGGDVLVVADSSVHSLAALQQAQRIRAGPGMPGARRAHSVKGEDAIATVPVGTTITLETGQLLADLSAHGESVVIARGGEGGSSATNERHGGLPGDSLHAIFELKSIADVGLVGFPNAGKSSILKALSRANPKVADYAFTTVHPNIGVIEYDDHGRVKLADIPGLIEGASENRGMGHSFLRHIERTHVLLFVVDLQGFQLSATSPRRTAEETVRLLADELDAYQPDLLRSRRVLLAANKIDVLGSAAESALERLEQTMAVMGRKRRFAEQPSIYPISAERGDGLGQLATAIRQAVDAAKADRLHNENQPLTSHLLSGDIETVRHYREQAKRANQRVW